MDTTNDKPGVPTVETADKAGSANTGGNPSIGERIANLIPGHKKRGGARPGAGRPKGSGSGDSVASNSRNVERGPVADQKENCRFFVETSLFLFVSGDEFIKRILLGKVRQYIRDEKRIAEVELEVVNKYAFTPHDKERLEFILYQLAIKYPILQKVGPEIMLLVFLVQYGLKTLQLAKAIEALKPVKRVEPVTVPTPA